MNKKLESLKLEFYKLQEDKKRLMDEYLKSDTLYHEKMLGISVQIARLHMDGFKEDLKQD